MARAAFAYPAAGGLPGRYRFGVDADLVPAAIVVLTALCASTLTDQLIYYTLGRGTEAIRRTANLALFAALLALALRRAPQALGALSAAPLLATLLALPALSVLWSIDRSESLQRLVPFYATTSLGVAVAAMTGFERGVRLFALGFVLLAALNLSAVVLFAEARGVSPWPDSWIGFHGHKNALGQSALLGVLLCLFAASGVAGRMRAVLLGGAAMNLALLSMTESRTAQALLVLGLALGASGIALRRGPALWLATTLVVAVAGGAAVWVLWATGVIADVLASFGRNATLSGRTEVWDVLVERQIAARPLAGYGFWSFWDPDAARVQIFKRLIRYQPHYSHNGFLETVMMFGYVGLTILAAVMAGFVRNLLVLSQMRGQARTTVAATVFLVLFVIMNVTEVRLFGLQDFAWVLFVFLALQLSALARGRDRPGAAP